MVSGTPEEARWVRSGGREALPPGCVERMIRMGLPLAHVAECAPLAEGFRNSNFQVLLDSGRRVVLRVYEHDPTLCQKEIDLLRWVRDSVPVPDVIHVEAGGVDELPPFALMGYVEGITFRALRRAGDQRAIAEAATSVGESLAAIHRTAFAKGGWLGPGMVVGAPLLEGANPLPRFVDRCLESTHLQARLAADLRAGVRASMWGRAAELAELERQPRLAHGDFNKRNTLVRCVNGRWQVAAILDWEFAVAGTPLMDLGNFLRYERALRPQAEPHFSSGYLRAGGTVPEDWRGLARLVDLVALCASLAEESLPEDVGGELVELVRGYSGSRSIGI